MSSSTEPTTVPIRANQRPSTIDFAISNGLDNILVQTHIELSSDHNPVQFIVPVSGTKPYIQNCITFTNWNLFQDLLTTSIPGNPQINSTEEIDEKISFLTDNIHTVINQSSKFKTITRNVTFIPLQIRRKITEKIDSGNYCRTPATLQLSKN
ncbi:hypothetical protein TNIN_453291 [Trichonephila inaurata madagascariensis]|uniref:Endonuclease/exonuclease/phosphatase domain-containing protein n=1 Tax=Trichonephila inaurata madagascariensis TaxID=2747483 RepID=A0A8X6YXY0_9ARAC|nr:hypothetical protein TNIN_453291 [Trichonephila inaurata madagascariensis]